MPTLESLKTYFLVFFAGSIAIIFFVYAIHVKILKDELQRANDKVTQLTTAVDEQNAKVNQWKDASDAKDVKLKQLQKRIRLDSILSQKDVVSTLSQHIPAGCEQDATWAEGEAEKQAKSMGFE